MMLSESDSDNLVACAAAYYVALSGEYIMRKVVKRKRRWWIDAYKKSRKKFHGSDMMIELTKEPSGRFKNLCRMSSSDFELLLSRIGPMISKRNTNMRESIPIQERLAVTLRFLASGESYASLAFLFKISKQTVSRCVDEVCKALIEELQVQVKLPQNEDEWLVIAKDFEMQWNFPNCLGAIDGKHIVIQCAPNSATEFFDSKGRFSVELLALVDADYCFTYVDIGCQGRISDGGVYNNSSLFSKLQTGQLNLPQDRQLPLSDKVLPCVFVGDSGFALSRHLMKPYPSILEKGSAKRVFNYRLCRARRVVENVFGIMASVFRVLRKPMLLDCDKVKNITLTCVLLHNFMRKSQSSATIYTPPGTFDTETDGTFVPGTWRNDQSGMTSFMSTKRTHKKPSAIAKAIRTSFAEYFITSGKLFWQDEYC